MALLSLTPLGVPGGAELGCQAWYLETAHLGVAGGLRCPDKANFRLAPRGRQGGVCGRFLPGESGAWRGWSVDKIVALFSLHFPPTPVETAPSNGAAGSWSALETVGLRDIGSEG